MKNSKSKKSVIQILTDAIIIQRLEERLKLLLDEVKRKEEVSSEKEYYKRISNAFLILGYYGPEDLAEELIEYLSDAFYEKFCNDKSEETQLDAHRLAELIYYNWLFIIEIFDSEMKDGLLDLQDDEIQELRNQVKTLK